MTFKVWFQWAIWEMMEEFRTKGRSVILCGDLNFAFEQIDHSRPQASIERMKLNEWGEHRGRNWMNRML